MQAGEAAIPTARGPREVERLLIEQIARAARETIAEPGLLAAPVRVVVPSQSLRDHVAARLVGELGSLAGVEIQTLYALALEVCERTGRVPASAEALLPVLVRSRARGEPAFRDRLEALVDGYGVVEASVHDLFDAGLEPVQRDAFEACLEEAAADGAEVELAGAGVRVALDCLEDLEVRGLAHRSGLLREARERLEADPERALPAREVVVHGFADATGVATDLIEALVRTRRTRVLLDATPEGPAFTRRLLERLSGIGAVERSQSERAGTRPRVRGFAAPGVQAEVREVARRIAGLLDDRVVPERIGVVVRDPAPYVLAVRRHFGRMGLPYSGVGIRAPGGRRARRVLALATLLRQGATCPTDAWLDALALRDARGRELSRVHRADLRLGLRYAGAARLASVGGLEVSGADVTLPVRRGLSVARGDAADGAGPSDGAHEGDGARGADGEDAADERRRIAPRRRLPGGVFARAVRAARDAAARLDAWPAAAPPATHLRELGRLLEVDLGWSRESDADRAVFDTLDGLERMLPDTTPLDLDDFVLMVARGWAGLGDEPIGGRGAGVQVLSVMEARARTFDHLFVLGLDRDVFPRPVREDPLLPDAFRKRLLSVLPDLPLKSLGWDEERFLFGQLLSASPSVTLSWQSAGDDGRASTRSTLIERLHWDGALEEEPAPSPLQSPLAARGPATAGEHALLAGLHRDRDAFESVLRVAVGGRASALARARRNVVDELDPAGAGVTVLGPQFGLVGPAQETADPRQGEVYVTRLEGLAVCGWRHFLERVLRIEPVPDPLEDLPGIDALLLGITVHAVLERIAGGAPGGTARALADLRAASPTPVSWPSDARLDEILREAAAEALREEGLGVGALREVLVRRARPYLDRARALEWPEPGMAIDVLGVEVEGDVELVTSSGAPRRIFFRADRVDRIAGDGGVGEGGSDVALALTDYKAGRTFADARRESTRHDRLVKSVRQGERLQAAVYARAAGGFGRGRYVFLRPDMPVDSAVIVAPADDAELAEGLEAAAAAALEVWDGGAFAPRLFDAKGREPRICQSCDMAQACLRGDTGARRRLRAWYDRQREAPFGSAAERALARLWRGVEAQS